MTINLQLDNYRRLEPVTATVTDYANGGHYRIMQMSPRRLAPLGN